MKITEAEVKGEGESSLSPPRRLHQLKESLQLKLTRDQFQSGSLMGVEPLRFPETQSIKDGMIVCLL